MQAAAEGFRGSLQGLEGNGLVGWIEQPFERGTLFYRDDEKRIYALFADKTWATYDDTWNASVPDDSCPSIPVPAGLYKPRRGFGFAPHRHRRHRGRSHTWWR